MRKILILFLVTALAFACHHKDPYEKARDLYDQTMEVHDQVMPRMGEILSIKHSLKGKLDSVTDPDVKIQIDSAMSALDHTYNGMMEWMADLQPVPGKEGDKESAGNTARNNVPSPDEMVKIQEESLNKIKELQSSMNKCLSQGKDLLGKLNN